MTPPALLSPQPEPFALNGWAEHHAMDSWLDHLETLVRAIGQRRMTADQLDRFALLLATAERDAIGRAERVT